MEYGLDISSSDGKVDFNTIKENGNSFVILKAGSGLNNVDPLFEKNYILARKAGLKIGAYWYSNASTSSQAIIEAQACYKTIEGKLFEYPIYIHIDDNRHLTVNQSDIASLALICENFCMYLEANGYFTGVYASKKLFDTELKNIRKIFDKWVANYDEDYYSKNNRTAYKIFNFNKNYYINGKYYSRNIVYDFDYPLVIKKAHLNGY